MFTSTTYTSTDVNGRTHLTTYSRRITPAPRTPPTLRVRWDGRRYVYAATASQPVGRTGSAMDLEQTARELGVEIEVLS